MQSVQKAHVTTQEEFDMSHKHDWFDDYMMYSMMNSNNSGGNNGGCSTFLLLIGIGLMLYGVVGLLAQIFM